VRAPDLAVVGIWLLVFAFVIIVAELALAAYWTARVARRAQTLSGQLASQQALLQADVERLRASLADTQVLAQPYRRVLRLLRHPITIALMQSFARRVAG
jgi:hypothetical protein